MWYYFLSHHSKHITNNLYINIFNRNIHNYHYAISMKMALEGAAKELVGSDIEFPEYDPYGFSKTASAEQMAW